MLAQRGRWLIDSRIDFDWPSIAPFGMGKNSSSVSLICIVTSFMSDSPPQVAETFQSPSGKFGMLSRSSGASTTTEGTPLTMYCTGKA